MPAEQRAEAQQAQLEERQRRLGDVAESALTEVASLHLPAGEDGSSELRMATGEPKASLQQDLGGI